MKKNRPKGRFFFTVLSVLHHAVVRRIQRSGLGRALNAPDHSMMKH